MVFRRLLRLLLNKVTLIARAQIFRYLLPVIVVFGLLLGGLTYLILWILDVQLLYAIAGAIAVAILAMLAIVKLVISPLLDKLEDLIDI